MILLRIPSLLDPDDHMVCPVGHQLTWRGRWVHVNHDVEVLWSRYDGCPPGASYPRTYWKSK